MSGTIIANDSLPGTATQRAPALQVAGLSKTFPGVRAIDNLSLTIAAGSIHALVGQNGCGKSTTIKVLSGFHRPDSGATATVDGEAFTLGSASEAQARGVRFVFQDLGLVPQLDALDNVGLGLGYSRRVGGLIDWKGQRALTRRLLKSFDVTIPPHAPLSHLTPIEQTAVAVVRAVAGGREGRGLLVLDEPTAALGHREVEQLYRLVRDVRDRGTAVLLVSHRLDEVLAVADEVTVMRGGRAVGGGAISAMTIPRLAGMIAGDSSVTGESRRSEQIRAKTPVALRIRGLRGRFLQGVDIDVEAGEIVGAAGLLGSGREEIAYAVAGADSINVRGEWEIGGAVVRHMTPQMARRYGIVFVPASRATESAFQDFDVRENLTLGALSELRSGMLLRGPRERAFTRDWLERVRVRQSSIDAPFATLSGGNQQKVILGRWLAVQPKVLTLAEPTAGVDIAAREALYELIKDQATKGLSVVVSSSDVQDLVHLADRVLVLRDGVIARELTGSDVNEHEIVAAIEGA
jgi:ribose transport system ATP-binding protein